jgi:hypothetical protein
MDEEERMDDANEEDKEEEDPLLEEGERLFTMRCQPREEEIHATATNS